MIAHFTATSSLVFWARLKTFLFGLSHTNIVVWHFTDEVPEITFLVRRR